MMQLGCDGGKHLSAYFKLADINFFGQCLLVLEFSTLVYTETYLPLHSSKSRSM